VNGKFEELKQFDCMVSAANSFGLMDGGVDLAIICYFGVELMDRVNTSSFRWTNIETGKHWSLGAFGQGPVGLPFSHFSETSGEAIHLKGG